MRSGGQLIRRAHPGARRRWRALHAAPDAGVELIAFAGVAVVLFLLTFGGVQAAMWYHARNLCQSAAQLGVQAARALNAPAGAGADAARHYLDKAGGGVHEIRVRQSSTTTSVTVSCSALADAIVPVRALSAVRQSATMPLERFTTQAGP